jgi:outer membrane protein TolC
MLRIACSCVSTGLSVLSVVMIFSTSWIGAQTPVPPVRPIPHELTLAQAEELLVQRNLAVLAARYKIDSSRAARLIAGYKPNPMLRIGAEQFPVYSPLKGSYPRFFATNSNAGAQPTCGVSVDKVWERGGKREFRDEQADATLKTSDAQMLDAVRTQIYQFNSQNLDQVERLRRVATYSYKEGASSPIELPDAQRYYNQALTSYNQARADYQSSLWQLEQATGRSLR